MDRSRRDGCARYRAQRHRFLTTWVRLPPFDCEEHAIGQYLWPMLINSPTVLSDDLAKASAATGAEMRRIGEVVAAKKQAEATSSQRSA